MRRLIQFASLLALSLGLSAAGPEPARADAMIAVLEEINALRREHKVPAVRLDPRLTAGATAQARDMAAHDYFDTRTPSGEQFETRLARSGYPARRLLVMIAAGFPTPLGVVADWASREDMMARLLDPSVIDVGLGYAAKHKRPVAAHLNHFWVLTLAEPARPAPGDWRAEMLRHVNAFRSVHGLAPLSIDLRLNSAAQRHAEDMADRDYIAHVSPDGDTVGQRATLAGYNWRRMLENLAAGHLTPAEAVESWKGSPGHRRALLDPEIRELGVGYAFLPEDDGRIRAGHYWALSMGAAR